ncbi:MAG: hypothetical protein M0P49_00625 [Bacilli bacterium]|nr:hypothetical protein [Bacilli bacterium]
MSNHLNQGQIMHNYNNEYREKFNEELFVRSDDDIIEELKKVILSCQRDKFFTLRVDSFTVVEDYNEINNILFKYDEQFKNKNKRKENQYQYINLKDSDIKLLIVRYYIAIKDDYEYVNVIIAVPRIVNKYYFRISGNIYSAMYQIVDASTYNNSTSNSKKHSVTLKTMFMPIRLYRNFQPLKTTNGETIKTTFYLSRIFNKSLGALKYILAKYGLYGAFNMLGIYCVTLTQEDPHDENVYTFMKNDIFINVPKMIFDADAVVQSLVATLYKAIIKDTIYENMFTIEYWIKSISLEFNNNSLEKGMSILDSLESIYDISTKESIRLPEEEKSNIYLILRWMIREFSNLKTKDNLDISIKKIRCSEYIASLYAMKISKGIYRVSDMAKKASKDNIRRAISTVPMYLLGAITKCKLVNYVNMVNDIDALTALKFTYKGISGLGESNNSSIPDIYRTLNISHLGRIDPDSSSATDPGVTGTICPLTTIYNGSFSDFQEPNYWEKEFSEIMNNYKAATGRKEAIIFKKEILKQEISSDDEILLEECTATMEELLKPIALSENMSRLFDMIELSLHPDLSYEELDFTDEDNNQI